MDGLGAKTAPIAYQLPISALLAACQRAPHPGQVNEIRRKCRYNGALGQVQITQCQLCCPPVWSVSRWTRVRVWETCAHVRAREGRSGDFPDSLAQCKPSCLPVYLFTLLIATRISYVTSPRIPQVNLSQTRSAVADTAARDSARAQAGTRISTVAHAHSDEVIHMVGITAAVWLLMAFWSDW